MSAPKDRATLALVRRFIDVDPQQAALALEALPEEEASVLLKALSPAASAALLERARPVFAAKALSGLLPEPGAGILERLDQDHLAEILRSLPDSSRAQALQALPEDRRKDAEEILSYPPHSAGAIMRTDVLSFNKDMKVREVIARLRALAGKGVTSYAYVVGPDRRLLGVLNMRDILLASPDQTLESIMRVDVFTVPAFLDREELVHLAGERRFFSVPVVDANGRLMGAIRSEDLLESSEAEATEDMQMMFGASADERPFSPPRFKVAKRLPWLHINLLTAFAAASVVAAFEGLISRVAVLAVFLPVVAGQGGNAGIQSLSVVLRGLVTREIRSRDAARLVLIEAGVGAVNGAAIGLVTGLAAWAWGGNAMLGAIVALAMVANMVAAGLAGAGIPLGLKRLGLDPALASGILLTTVTDVVGFSAFLGLAAACESWLR